MKVVVAVVLALTLAGCGVTGPKLHVAPAASTTAGGTMPGVEGSLSDQAGVTLASGDFFINPPALVGMIMEYVGKLFHKGPAAPVAAPAS